MQWELMSKLDASQVTAEWQRMEKDKFDHMVDGWSTSIRENLNSDYCELREEVLRAFRQVISEVDNDPALRLKKDYYTDLMLALRMYEILEKRGFSVRMASNDQIWIYLCVKVFPDLVQNRYPGTKVKTDGGTEHRNVNEERFWKTRRRIYLKVLWWYIYLSLQYDAAGKPDLDKTFETLKKNSTDEIVQIVERSGPAGYRVDVYREIMSFYADNRNRYDNSRFRQVMVLNTARTQVVEPGLMSGGIQTYVRELFEYFDAS